MEQETEESTEATVATNGPVSIAPAIDDDDDQDPEAEEVSDTDIFQSATTDTVNYDAIAMGEHFERLLADLQVESRITARYNYKLVNKYNLLLHALLRTHDREYELVQHLQTKRKILNALKNFVKSDEARSARIGAAHAANEEAQQAIEQVDEENAAEDGEEEENEVSVEDMSAATIRDTLLKQKNKLNVLEATKRIHVLKIKHKEFEKTLLTLHYSKMVKPVDLKKEIKEARRLVNELQLENSGIHQEMGKLQTELRMEEKETEDIEKVVDKLELEMLNKQSEAQSLQHKPIQVQKDADKEAAKLEQAQDGYNTLCEKLVDGMEYFRTHQSRIDKLTNELNILVREETKLNTQKRNSLREIERMMTQMEALITKEHIMMEKAGQMNEKLQQAIKLKQKTHDEQTKILNETSKALRISQRLEKSIKTASEAFTNAKLAHEKMRAAFDAARPSEEDTNWQRLSKMLEREIQNLKVSLEKKLEESTIKASMVDQLKFKLNDLYDNQIASGKELQELIRATVRKRREREEKSEQCIKLDSQIQRFDQDIQMREIVIGECQRACKELSKEIETLGGKISGVKLEKSIYMHDCEINKEKLAELKGIFKELEAESQQLAQHLQDLEKQLKDQYYLILNARLARDSVRNETLRNRDKFRNYRNQKEELLLENKTLRREISRQKQEVAVIRKQFETFLMDANAIALNVRERIEEICTFAEYIHTYEAILLKGQNEVTVRELERTKLLSLEDELRKHVLIVKRNQPNEIEFVKKIENLRKIYQERTETRRMLELQLNEDNSAGRVREINFEFMKTRENLPALEKKLDSIEELLAVRDALGLERTLIENHVTRISNDSLARALYLKETYGEQVKIKATIMKSLSAISRQIDGLICENSIASAQAETAENLYIMFRKQLKEAEKNIAEGLPPTPEIEAEWKRMQWRKKMMKRACEQKSTVGFLRKIKQKPSYKIDPKKLYLEQTETQDKLENPENSVLGWRFSVITKETSWTELKERANNPVLFLNSAVNPRKSSLRARRVLALKVGASKQTTIKSTVCFQRDKIERQA